MATSSSILVWRIPWLLIVVPSLLLRIMVSRAQGLSNCTMWAQQLGHVDLRVYDLSFPKACGIFLDPRIEPDPLNWQVESYLLDRQGSSMAHFLMISDSHCQSISFRLQHWVYKANGAYREDIWQRWPREVVGPRCHNRGEVTAVAEFFYPNCHSIGAAQKLHLEAQRDADGRQQI